MINPSEVNPLQLPSLPYADREQLPQQACIYFVIDLDDEIKYIGMTRNVRGRLGQPDHNNRFKRETGLRVSYLAVDNLDLLPEIETALIGYFQPSLNVLGTEREADCHKKHLVSKEQKKMQRTSLTIDEDLIKEFKIYCERQHRSISAQIAFFMQEAIEDMKRKDSHNA